MDDKTAKQAAAANDALTKLGYSADKGWKTTMTAADWAKVAANNPGYMVQGTSFAKTAQEAAAAAVNNPAVTGTTAEKADPNNWKLVYNNQCMTYPSMAYQDRNGNISWGSGFVECGVAVWVNIASGGSFRLLCDNATNAPPVATQLPPSLPPVTPNPVVIPPVVQHFCKADIPIGDVRCEEKPETMQVCIRNSGDQTLRTINKKDFNSATMSTNPADCVKPPKNVQRCDSKTGTDNVTISEDAAKDTNRYKPVGDVACHQVEVIKACIKDSGDQTLRPVDKFDSKTMSTNPADCVKPFVCPPGTFPNPSNPKDCLNSKDPAVSPPLPADHDPAQAPVGKTPLPTPTSNQVDPTTPVTTPAPPVTQTPGTTPTPTTPVPVAEAPAPTPANPGTAIADPDQPTVAASVAVPVVQKSAPVVAPAPVAKATPVVQAAAAPVTAAPAPVTTASAVYAAAPVGATSAPVATATVTVAHVATAAAPAAHVGG